MGNNRRRNRDCAEFTQQRVVLLSHVDTDDGDGCRSHYFHMPLEEVVLLAKKLNAFIASTQKTNPYADGVHEEMNG